MTLLDRSSAPGALARCQYEGLPIGHTFPMGTVRVSRLLRERARQRRFGTPDPGRPSRFGPGEWVRVRDAATIRQTLDQNDSLGGLWFTREQWSFCGRTLRVEHVVRRMLDDEFRMRSISRTVSLAGATCSGFDHTGGCGRECALLFRDVWLEPVAPEPEGAPGGLRASVRPLDEIARTLDRRGRLEGVPFQPQMAELAGAPLTGVRRYEPGDALPSWKHVRGEWYVSPGSRCDGSPLTSLGGCDRQCALLWHRSWLDLAVPTETVGSDGPGGGSTTE